MASSNQAAKDCTSIILKRSPSQEAKLDADAKIGKLQQELSEARQELRETKERLKAAEEKNANLDKNEDQPLTDSANLRESNATFRERIPFFEALTRTDFLNAVRVQYTKECMEKKFDDLLSEAVEQSNYGLVLYLAFAGWTQSSDMVQTFPR